MASKHGPRTKQLSSHSSKAADSPASSGTSSTKQFLETSIDGQSSPASSSARSKPRHSHSENVAVEAKKLKENVTVTVRFRPLSPREIRQGEEIAWYADGETILRNEHNPSIAYAYDKVFGPTTTTRHVYDVAAQHVVNGAMEGVNGTIFAYGVTSSGKTHTMHGDQRSPGIIPLAVKEAFSIIQETPNREYLLRVTYLEIYNEVVNDLLNPTGHNLRIREDAQGTFVEGIKEEVVLSSAHALSLIAAGEEHRHVGSTNFNLLSSRSHTIFTLTVESSSCGENCEGEAVNLSQLNLIDLAGSESSKAETTGVRRKEGSYINKSLLTLGTVISKITDSRAAHIPYRDSKLTRLLQSSLSGHGRVSLICTVTPSSSSSEETHNTLKFAHRAKHIEIQAAQNKIIDEKSLIKKYQNEIRCLKEELDQLKRGIAADTSPQPKDVAEDDIFLLKQKLEDGQFRLQTRLEQEEEAKAALLGRIQRLTKLILVSTKASQSSRMSQWPGPRRRHSFGEEELAYLPHKRRDLILEDENVELYVPFEGNTELATDTLKEKKTRKNGLFNWLKPRKRDNVVPTLTSPSDKSSGVKSTSTPSTPQAENGNLHAESRLSNSLLLDIPKFPDYRDNQNDALDQETPMTSIQSMDQTDLLREQHKILSDQVALLSSTLKRLSEEAIRNPQSHQIKEDTTKVKEEIRMKTEQIALLEKQIEESLTSSQRKIDSLEISESMAELKEQLNEKTFELEVKIADNRVIQEKLNQKISECEELQELVASLKHELSEALEPINFSPPISDSQKATETKNSSEEIHSENGNSASKDRTDVLLLQAQETKIEELERKLHELALSKEQLEGRNQKLAEESSYAKGLASAAAVELKALSEEVSKLMNQNDKLAAELAASKLSSPTQQQRRTGLTGPARNGPAATRRDGPSASKRTSEQGLNVAEIKRELALSREREASFEAALAERDRREAELCGTVEESRQREAYLENELANMWVLVAKLKKAHGTESEASESTSDTRRSDGGGFAL